MNQGKKTRNGILISILALGALPRLAVASLPLKTLIQYKEGKHNGIYKTWSKDEIPLSDDFYENGELKKRTKYSNGKATEVLEYSNGKVVSSTKLETGKEQ